MIFWLHEYFSKSFFKCDFFLSLISRSFFSLFTAWFFSLWIGPHLIYLLKKFNICQVIRNSGPPLHFSKNGTPTMGGIMIIFSIMLSILLWSNLCNRYIWYVIFILISYGVIGFFDDYYKILKKNSNGLNIFLKYCLLSVIALLLIVVMFILEMNITGTYLIVPFFKDVTFKLGIGYVFLGYLVIVGTSNAVNLSDGLDGLVIMPIVLITFGLGIITLIYDNIYFSNGYLCNVQYIFLIKELIVVCSAIIGSGLGFLWFNIYPAQIFMGDVGSLSLGGVLGVISILLRQELSLLIMGALFVLETISVILQVYFFKLYGYRIFLMAPVHHHFELKGVP